jgi:hypothetical protein
MPPPQRSSVQSDMKLLYMYQRVNHITSTRFMNIPYGPKRHHLEQTASNGFLRRFMFPCQPVFTWWEGWEIWPMAETERGGGEQRSLAVMAWGQIWAEAYEWKWGWQFCHQEKIFKENLVSILITWSSILTDNQNSSSGLPKDKFLQPE